MTVVTEEDLIPYDRTLISKQLPAYDTRKSPLRSAEFLSEADIDFKMGSAVSGINPTARRVTLLNGDVLQYDKLCIATGGKVKKVKIPGADLKGVHYLRSSAD